MRDRTCATGVCSGLLWLAFSLAVLLIPRPAVAGDLVINVSDEAGLRAALTQAQANTEATTVITMAAGEYVIDGEALPEIETAVDINGSGNVEVSAAPGYESRFLFVRGNGVLKVDNLIIRGFATSAVIVATSEARFTNCVFENNTADSLALGGGAIAATGLSDGRATIVVENCVFRVNSVSEPGGDRGGGAVSLSSADAQITDSEFTDNTSVEPGGAIFLTRNSSLDIQGGSFTGNTSEKDGGAVFAEDSSSVTERGASFNGNMGKNGGAIKVDNGELRALDSSFSGNGWGVGGAINAVDAAVAIIWNRFINNMSISNDGNHLSIEISSGFVGGNVFSNPSNSIGDENVRLIGSPIKFANNTALTSQATTNVNNRFNNSDLFGPVALRNNAFGLPVPFRGTKGASAACVAQDLISGEPFESLGYNIFSDDSCPSDGPGDMNNTDPMFGEETKDGVVPLLPGSPGIDSGPSEPINGFLPCSYRDVRGLARPQDGDGDGTAECDVGAWEQQAGDDLTAAASGAYFGIGRSGEGIFVEMLGGGLALVYVFTYTPDGSGQAWFLGVGGVVGNSIVVDDMEITRGGIFGEDFDSDDVERIAWGSFSVSLPDCEAGDPGVMALTGNADMGYEPLIQRPVRLTSVLACPGAKARDKNVQAEFSGSWFDRDHDGEGFIIEVISADTAVVQWFTYDDKGNQFWIQGVGTIDGKTITVKEAFFTRGTAYGSGFDPDDVERVDWGTVTMVFDSCTRGSASYESLLAEFGSGAQDLRRITSLDGLACE